ncbi:tRNA 2-selenouridine(34) synthase MnmH [Candidatus Woesearchaeota archaeon]|nr:tRNA 2-selenouridine(34) synthase MnmH [Candidatus Woesearchaeota archaeon]
METISAKDALKLKGAVFVDTRSPKEFEIDTLPNAIQIPILDNEQRHVVGLVYKASNEKGMELGYEFYHKNLPSITKEITSLDKSKKIVIFCARGGMRSKTITELALKLGYDAVQLDGGYKSYRAFMRKTMENYKPPKLIVLYGLAGSGKTDIIKKLNPSVDFEGFAQHRSSLFGAIGLSPSGQKKFETLLFNKFEQFKDEPYVFVEGESRKIGSIFIPNSIFQAMNQGVSVKVNCSIENRAKRIVGDYFVHGEDEKIKEIISSLKEALSNEVVIKLLKLMDEKDYQEVSRILLEDYYDLRYQHQLENIDYDYEVNSDSVDKCVDKLNKFAEKI